MKPLQVLKKTLDSVLGNGNAIIWGGDGVSGIICSKAGNIGFIASWGEGWEHVSISLKKRCPTWEEMCFFKDIFWNDNECVIQYHPPRKNYVNCHKYCLHLWRPINEQVPMPPKILVGI